MKKNCIELSYGVNKSILFNFTDPYDKKRELSESEIKDKFIKLLRPHLTEALANQLNNLLNFNNDYKQELSKVTGTITSDVRDKIYTSVYSKHSGKSKLELSTVERLFKDVVSFELTKFYSLYHHHKIASSHFSDFSTKYMIEYSHVPLSIKYITTEDSKVETTYIFGSSSLTNPFSKISLNESYDKQLPNTFFRTFDSSLIDNSNNISHTMMLNQNKIADIQAYFKLDPNQPISLDTNIQFSNNIAFTIGEYLNYLYKLNIKGDHTSFYTLTPNLSIQHLISLGQIIVEC